MTQPPASADKNQPREPWGCITNYIRARAPHPRRMRPEGLGDVPGGMGNFMPLSLFAAPVFSSFRKMEQVFLTRHISTFFLEDTIKNRGKLEQREVWDGPALDMSLKEV